MTMGRLVKVSSLLDPPLSPQPSCFFSLCWAVTALQAPSILLVSQERAGPGADTHPGHGPSLVKARPRLGGTKASCELVYVS